MSLFLVLYLVTFDASLVSNNWRDLIRDILIENLLAKFD